MLLQIIIKNIGLITGQIKGMGGGGGLTAKEEAIKSQLNYMSNKQKIIAYHFPVGDYWRDLRKDQYFGSFFENQYKFNL